MLDLDIQVRGRTFRDLELALEEVMKKVKDEFRSGQDENETGSYNFDISGEDGEYAVQGEDGDVFYLTSSEAIDILSQYGVGCNLEDYTSDPMNAEHEVRNRVYQKALDDKYEFQAP